jgi:hypothetical protein
MPHTIEPRASRRILFSMTALVSAGLFLAACSATTNDPAAEGEYEHVPASSAAGQPVEISDSYPGSAADSVDSGERPNVEAEVAIFNPDEPDSLTLVLNGSSSCPEEPVSYSTNDAGIVDIQTATADADQVCTKDFVPTTYVMVAPATLDPDKGLTINSGMVEILVQQ